VVLLVGLSALDGCDDEGPAAAGLRRASAAESPEARLQAMADPNAQELALRIDFFHAARGRLPAAIDEVGEELDGAGWPRTPRRGRDGVPLGYRATGERTYELHVAVREEGTQQPMWVAVPIEAPTQVPEPVEPGAFRRWWKTKRVPTLVERLRSEPQAEGGGG
jgi:hypothetical protein